MSHSQIQLPPETRQILILVENLPTPFDRRVWQVVVDLVRIVKDKSGNQYDGICW
jgi:hypothetical protein